MQNLTKKRRRFQFWFALIAIIVISPIIAVLYSYSWYDSAINNAPTDSSETYSIAITEGDTLTSIAQALEENEVINSKLALQIYLELNKIDPKIKIGAYELPKNKSLKEIISILEQGVFQSTITVTIKEATLNEDIADIVDTQMKLSGGAYVFDKEEFLKICSTPDDYTFSQDIQKFLDDNKPAGNDLTGFLYPDTYFLTADMTSQEVIEFMIINLIQKVNDANISYTNSNITNLYDAIILASILEKESSGDSDRDIISGVFHNRLSASYPLESDVTINFALKTNKVDITYADLEVDSPYNTYKNIGLPPGPINNPGIKAILSAITPEDTEYFYFLYSSKNKQTYFATTFSQHQQNIYNYL